MENGGEKGQDKEIIDNDFVRSDQPNNVQRLQVPSGISSVPFRDRGSISASPDFINDPETVNRKGERDSFGGRRSSNFVAIDLYG